MKEKISLFMSDTQDKICNDLSKVEGASFSNDFWQRDAGGGGRTCVLKGDHVFEKAAVNVSKVFGSLSEREQLLFSRMMQEKGIKINDFSSASFYATGISLIIHPINPFVPAIHCNYRYFELKSSFDFVSWFGGGVDLTPYYYFEEDEKYFHESYKNICDSFDPSLYDSFKHNCDRYFFLPHRNEHRGVGGIFFDYMYTPNCETVFEFIKTLASSFSTIYLTLVHKRVKTPFTDLNKRWQRIRRGRYVEFNLLYDKGTKFGLETNGRTESIFVSMPPSVDWDYEFKVLPNSLEEKLLKRLTPRHSY